MRRTTWIVWMFCLVATMSCASQSNETQSNETQPSEPQAKTGAEATATPPAETEPKTATPPDAWVAERTAEARDRLAETDAGQLVWQSIEAHGGLTQWFANGPLFFRFTYSPLGDRTVRDTFQTVDTWSSRARHQLADAPGTEFGWDGEQAWVSPADADPKTNARFWALTPYYFVAMPFVLADPGVRLEKTGTAELHGRPHDVLKATFGDGVGDSPDDYYVIYLDRETGRFGGLRYVVSYPGFFPDGGHSPEKLMVYEGDQMIDGITLAKAFPTYKWDAEAGERGERVTDVTMTEVEFRPETPDAYFAVPDDAKVIEGY